MLSPELEAKATEIASDPVANDAACEMVDAVASQVAKGRTITDGWLYLHMGARVAEICRFEPPDEVTYVMRMASRGIAKVLIVDRCRPDHEAHDYEQWYWQQIEMINELGAAFDAEESAG